MVFSSNIFLFAFLPVFLAIYYLTPVKYRSVTILVGSFAFYAWWRVDFMFLFLAMTVWNFEIQKRITATGSARWLQAGIIGNLLVLLVFKYLNFGIDSMNALLGDTIPALNIILPIGISFYIFHGISFLVDIYKKDAPAPRSFWDFAAFMALFPHLIAGPVLRYKDLAEQFRARPHDMAHFSEGAHRFMIGFAQKVLIADSVAPLADLMFSIQNPTFVESWLGALAYTIQLYFDFMGYSSMAVGLGLMMGFRLIENFNHPYLSRSITEFWRRWHISLSQWLKDYLYIPLGGNRDGEAKTYRNLFLTMLLGGAWHGANWTFVIWGAWHGLWLCLERLMGLKEKSWPAIMTIPTLLFVILGWVMFRAKDVPQAMAFYKGMAGMNGFGITESAGWQVTGFSLTFLVIGWAVVYLHPKFFDFRQRIANSPAMVTDAYKRPIIAIPVIALFLLAVTKLSAASYSPFLYFQF
jgi:alginate O-acetyltransferase complex protein AlgI